MILMSLLQGLTENVMSGDVMQLAAFRAIRICVSAGLDETEVEDRILAFLDAARKNRKKNPLSSMF